MASGNSLSLLLRLFTILLVLECSNADGYQEYLGRKKGSKVEKDVSLHKVAFAGTSAHANGIMILVGRKNLYGNDDEKKLFISAKGNRKPANPSKTLWELQKESNRALTQVKKDEDFLEAADEIANLMRKDYRGASRARRKPPINNRVPGN